MDKERFWSIIEEARKGTDHFDDMFDPIVEKLSKLEDAEIMQWRRILDAYMKLSYKNNLWAAAYVVNDGCSDDGFDYFRGWLIAQGKEVLLNAFRNPDSLADLDITAGEAEFESMLSISSSAFFMKHNLKHDYEAFNDVRNEYPLNTEVENSISEEIVYVEDVESDWVANTNLLINIVPRLCQRFM